MIYDIDGVCDDSLLESSGDFDLLLRSDEIDVGVLQEAVARKVHEGTIAISQARFASDIATGKTPKKNIKEIPEWKRTRQRSEILKEFYQNQLPLPPPESRLPINVTKRKRKIEQEAELVDL